MSAGVTDLGPIQVIDAHHHLWDPARADYPWLTGDYAPIRRRFGPEDLAPGLAAAGVDRTILVQTRSSLDETREFLAHGPGDAIHRRRRGLGRPHGSGRRRGDRRAPGRTRRRSPRRNSPSGPRRARCRLAPATRCRTGAGGGRRGRPGLRAPGAAPRAAGSHRPSPAAMPEARFVVDHLAKPPIASGELEPWRGLLAGFGPLRACRDQAVGPRHRSRLAGLDGRRPAAVRRLRRWSPSVPSVFCSARTGRSACWRLRTKRSRPRRAR